MAAGALGSESFALMLTLSFDRDDNGTIRLLSLTKNKDNKKGL